MKMSNSVFYSEWTCLRSFLVILSYASGCGVNLLFKELANFIPLVPGG